MIGSETTNCGQINVKEESRKEKQFMGIKNKSELKESFWRHFYRDRKSWEHLFLYRGRYGKEEYVNTC